MIIKFHMSISKCLVFKLGAIGDLFYAAPILDELRQRSNSVQISWAVNSSLVEIVKTFKHVEPVVIDSIPSKNFINKIIWVFKTRSKINNSFDLIYLLHRHFGYLLVVLGKGQIYQIVRPSTSFSVKLVRKLLTRIFNVTFIEVAALTTQESLAYKKVYQTSIKDNTLKSWGVKKHNLVLPDIEKTLINKIVVHIGGGNNHQTEFELKQWPHMKELIKDISKLEDIVLIGAKDAIGLSSEILLSGEASKIKNLVGQTTLTQLISILSQAKLVIGSDSGPLHIADQLGIPTLGIYGPTSDISWGLIGNKSLTVKNSVACSPCYKDDGVFPKCRNNHICMNQLSTQTVYDNYIKLMRQVDYNT